MLQGPVHAKPKPSHQVLNLRRLEKMQFPTKDEDFKRRLLKG